MRLTVEDFMKFRNLIYDKAGIYFAPKKIYFLKKRLEKRMDELKMDNPMDYLNMLKFRDKTGAELQEFLNQLTTNETYFFREVNQLNSFAESCLKERLESQKEKGKKIRIWSAGL